MTRLVQASGTGPGGSNRKPATLCCVETAASPTRLLPLMADTQAVGPGEFEEREMEPDGRTELG
jgi:hypothetical protein